MHSTVGERSTLPRLPLSYKPVHVQKPWGYELIWAHTDRYAGKILRIDAGRRLSLQYHEQKEETLYVLAGRMAMELEGPDGQMMRRVMVAGESAHVPPGRRHRMTAIETCDVLEASTPELDDVVRLQDDFDRTEPSLCK